MLFWNQLCDPPSETTPDRRLTMTASVFVGTSLDGFIARLDGSFDFLPADGGEAHGYDEFIAGGDAIRMGRPTSDLSAATGGVVEQMAGDPAQIVSQLAATGAQHLYIDGGITIQQFLRA